MKLKIIVFHVYQDPNNPTEQTIIISADYPTLYALFQALIDSHKDFALEINTEQDKL